MVLKLIHIFALFLLGGCVKGVVDVGFMAEKIEKKFSEVSVASGEEADLSASDPSLVSSAECHFDRVKDNKVSSANSCDDLLWANFDPVTGDFSWIPTLTQVGEYEVLVTTKMTDGLTIEHYYHIIVGAPGATTLAPVISNIPDVFGTEDVQSIVSFFTDDSDSVLDCSTSVSFSSDNTSLIDVADVVFSGTIPNCELKMKPKADQYGVANITLTVTDGSLITTTTFNYNVENVLDPITITTAEPSPTNSASFDYTVDFDQPVNNVDASDFELDGLPAGVSILNVTNVDGTIYTVTVGVNAGTVASVQLDLLPTHDITDVSLALIDQVEVEGELVLVDRELPSLAGGGIIRAASAAQNATGSSIDFEVTFSEAVNGVDATDFALSSTGSAAGVVSNITTSDNIVYIVTVDTLTGMGNLQLDLNDADGDIQDVVGNLLSSTSEAGSEFYTIDKIQATITMSSSESSPTQTSPIPVTIEFSEDVTGFDASDIIINKGTVSNFVAVDGNTYTFDLVPNTWTTLTVDIDAAAAVDSFLTPNAAAPQFSIIYQSPPCTGTLFDDICWQVAAGSETCDTTCALDGGNHSATRYYAGSHGTMAQCQAAYDAVIGPPTDTVIGVIPYAGCYQSGTEAHWAPYGTLSDTLTGSASLKRICACKYRSPEVVAPNEIVNLSATAGSTNTVALTWENGGGFTSDFVIAYAVGPTAPADCSTAQVGEGNVLAPDMSGVVNHVVGGLLSNTEYSFRVCASNDLPTAELSAGLTVTVTTAVEDIAAQAIRPVVEDSEYYYDSPLVINHPTYAGPDVSGTDTLLIVAIRVKGGTAMGEIDLAGVEANGLPMTKLVTINGGGTEDSTLEIWYLLSPQSGANSIYLNTNSALVSPVMHATAFSNVDQVTPFRTEYTLPGLGDEFNNTLVTQVSDQSELIYGVLGTLENNWALAPDDLSILLDFNTSFNYLTVFAFGGVDTYHFLMKTGEAFNAGLVLLPIQSSL